MSSAHLELEGSAIHSLLSMLILLWNQINDLIILFSRSILFIILLLLYIGRGVGSMQNHNPFWWIMIQHWASRERLRDRYVTLEDLRKEEINSIQNRNSLHFFSAHHLPLSPPLYIHLLLCVCYFPIQLRAWVSPIDRVADYATHESKTRCLSLRLELYHEYVLSVLLMICWS